MVEPCHTVLVVERQPCLLAERVWVPQPRIYGRVALETIAGIHLFIFLPQNQVILSDRCISRCTSYISRMSSSDMAKDKAARLLKKRGSISSSASNEYALRHHKKNGSMSTISFMDEPSHDDHIRAPVRMENTYQIGPGKKFPVAGIQGIIKEVLESYLMDEKYEPELCRHMTKTLSEVLKARVKDLRIPRYKIICLVHIGQLNNHAMVMGSRCLWDSSCDTYSSFEYRNNSLYAVGTVYGVYAE